MIMRKCSIELEKELYLHLLYTNESLRPLVLDIMPVSMCIPKVEYLNCPVNPFLPPKKSKAETVQSSLEQILVQGSYLYL